MKKLLTLTAITAALIGTASAAPRITAQSIIVNPVQSSVGVSVWTDRDPSGNSVPNYLPGDHIRLYTSVSSDAYVYLFNVDPAGKVDMILPNRYAGGQNYVRANTTKAFPAANDTFTFDIAAPYGLNKVLALASTTPLNVDQIASFRNQQQGGFASVNVQGQQQLAQALSIVVNPVPQNTWSSDTAYYNVAGRQVRQPAPIYVPAPVASYPWLNQDRWSTEEEFGRESLPAVHERYANQLRSQGYRLITIRTQGHTMHSEWQRGQSDLRIIVKEQGNRFRIDIEQQN